MTATLQTEQTDADLIAAVRGGDTAAFGMLFERHRDAADRLARQLTTPGDADDLVSEAFVKVLGQLQAGKGPDVSFRAYLLTAVRRLHIDRIRASRRVEVTDDQAKLDAGVEDVDAALAEFERGAAGKAFTALPERWQMVLWHLDVEGQKPVDIAPLLGMSANSVSALAYRAREGLRQEYLRHHLADVAESACQWTTEHLGAHVRHGLSNRDSGKVEAHLDECRRCLGVYLELREVNADLRGVLGPLVLGGALSGYLSAPGVVAGVTAGGVKGLIAGVVEWFKGAGSGAQVASAAAVVGVVAVAAVAATSGDTPVDPAAAPPVAAASEEPTPAEETDPAPEPAPPPAEEPTPTPPPEPEPARSPSPSPTPGPSASPTPTPEPEPEPEPGATDLAVTSATVRPYDRPLQKLVTARFSATPQGPGARRLTAVATIRFDRQISYQGVRTPAWTCDAAEGQWITELRCTTAPVTDSVPELQVKAQRLGLVNGEIRISAEGSDDPVGANDSRRF